GDVVRVAGIVAAVGRRFTKRGEQYAILRLEDLTGGVSVVAFPSVFEKASALVVTDQILLVKGRVDLRGRELQLVALEVSEPDVGESPRAGGANGNGSGSARPLDPLQVDVPLASWTGGLIGTLKQLF